MYDCFVIIGGDDGVDICVQQVGGRGQCGQEGVFDLLFLVDVFVGQVVKVGFCVDCSEGVYVCGDCVVVVFVEGEFGWFVQMQYCVIGCFGGVDEVQVVEYCVVVKVQIQCVVVVQVIEDWQYGGVCVDCWGDGID